MTSYASSFATLTTPEYTTSGDQSATITGHVVGAGAGRGVSLYQDNSDGTVTRITGTVCDANGNFAITLNVPVVSTYHLYASAITVGADTYGSAISDKFTIKSLHFWDSFDYASVGEMLASGKWALRQPQYDLPGRTDMKADASALAVASSVLSLKVLPDPASPGRVLVGHITTGADPATGPLRNFVRGHIEARIKFNRFKGAHGSAWHQGGYGPGAAELDVVEFFGERGPHATDVTKPIYSQFVQHTVYTGDPSTADTTDTLQDVRYSWTGAAGSTAGPDTVNLYPNADYTFWNSWHTYAAFWNSDGYHFSIDGVPVGDLTALTPATVPGELILSLLVSDSEHPTLDTYLKDGVATYDDYVMKVDWVRCWR